MGDLDELYFSWLTQEVSRNRSNNPRSNHHALLKQLYTTEFVWIIRNDDNRCEDGRDLRYEFLRERMMEAGPAWTGQPCSILEMMIGLARRMAFETGGRPPRYFWLMIENLDLMRMTDAQYRAHPSTIDYVDETLECFIWRRYHKDGRGGLFPLKKPGHDQTRVEVWYQWQEYLIERM